MLQIIIVDIIFFFKLIKAALEHKVIETLAI